MVVREKVRDHGETSHLCFTSTTRKKDPSGCCIMIFSQSANWRGIISTHGIDVIFVGPMLTCSPKHSHRGGIWRSKTRGETRPRRFGSRL